MQASNLPLCRKCEAIDLASYFPNERNVMRRSSGFVGPAQDAVVLCSLADLHATSSACAFCKLVMEALLMRWGPQYWTTADEYIETRTDPDASPQIHLYSYLFAEDRWGGSEMSPSSRENTENRPVFRLGISLRGLSDTNIPAIDHAADIQLLSTDSLVQQSGTTFHGRIIDSDRANIQLAREWVNECDRAHGDVCETVGGEDDIAYIRLAPRDLRVIDVNSMCIIPLPAGARYVALSYCWAQSTRHFTTTKLNIASLQTRHSISGVWDELPGTIQDAIGCVRELGQEFLWVDALCIVQDDQNDKDEQILQMDRVYDNAFLTIVSAPLAVRDAPRYDGLPGYRQKCQPFQFATSVQGLELCTTLLSVDQVMAGSYWSTRAWTFQEYLLSRRQLFFTDMQLYFQCSCGVFCEDVAGEGKSHRALIYPGTSLWNISGLHNDLSEGQSGTRRALSRSLFPNSSAAGNYYEHIVGLYTSREMSNQGDALAALEGVISVLRVTMNTEFIHGLPETYLDDALLWQQRGPHRRRTVLPTTNLGVSFPSWSWVGWNVMSDYLGEFPGYIKREVEWYLIHRDGTGFNLSPSNTPKPIKPYNPSTRKDIRPRGKPPVEFLSGLRPREELTTQNLRFCYLACWTNTATFYLFGDLLDIDEDHSNWRYHDSFIISDHTSQPVGSIFLEKSFHETIEQHRYSGFEFMLLSRSNQVKAIVNMEEMYPMEEWCFVNVMMIQREGDKVERLGVGVVHELAWISAEPKAVLLHLR